MKEAPDLALQVQAHMDDRSFIEHHEGEMLVGLIKSDILGEVQWRALLLFVANFGYAARKNTDE